MNYSIIKITKISGIAVFLFSIAFFAHAQISGVGEVVF